MRAILVLGGGQDVLKEVEAALRIGEFAGVVTCNDMTVDWPGPIEAAVSLHGEKWPLWIQRRRLTGRELPSRIFAHTTFSRSILPNSELITDYADHLWPGQKDSGSSGLFAVKVALDELGYERVVCCGIPMTNEARHYFDKRPWGGAASHRRGWKQALPYLQDRVRSMSGWTAEILGKPTVAWLAEGNDHGKLDCGSNQEAWSLEKGSWC